METQAGVQPMVRESTAADKETIFKLREAVYGVPFDNDVWHWKLEKHSGGIPAKIYIAEDQGTIMGLRPTIVERLKILDKVWLIGRAVDIMVHPDFRGRGISSRMANEAFAAMETTGVFIQLGFPNEASSKAYARGRSYWTHVCSVPLLIKPLHFDTILRKFIKNSLIRAPVKLAAQAAWRILFRERDLKAQSFTVYRTDTFDDRFDELWKEASKRYRILLVRDKSFLRWRFTDKPDATYTVLVSEQDGGLLGYIVLGNGQMFGVKVGFILDVLTVNRNDVAGALVSEAIEYFKGQGVDAIGCLMLEHTPYFKVMKRAGFILAPKRLIHRKFHFGVQVKPSTLPDQKIIRRDNWFITFADIDTV